MDIHLAPILAFLIVILVVAFAPPIFGIQNYDYQHFPWNIWTFISAVLGAGAYGIVYWFLKQKSDQ